MLQTEPATNPRSPATRSSAVDRSSAARPLSSARSRLSFALSRRVRRWTLVLHVIVSVGWLGLDLALLTLGASALVTDSPEISHAAYIAMDLVAGSVLIPIALLSLTTGLVLALGTKWGLVRYWWVLVKLAITTVAATLTIFLLAPGLDQAARSDLDELLQERVNFVVAPTVALTMYVTATVLSILKPWGRTRWGRVGS